MATNRIALSTIKGSRISNLIRLIKAQIFGLDDLREINEAMPYGVDSCPVSNTNGVFVNTTSNGVSYVVGYVNKQQKATAGEMRIYSTNSSGVFKFNVWLKGDGTVLIGDSDTPASYTNFLTKFNELKTGFDTLKGDYNTFIANYNLHTHSNSGGTTTPPSPTGSPSTASIDSSKATKIKTN